MSLAPLLTLPAELRLRIYEFIFDAQIVGYKLERKDRFSVVIRAVEEDKASHNITIADSPFTLIRVCRTLHDEIGSLLPGIEDLDLHFCNLTRRHAQAWMQSIPTEQVAKIRHLKITGWDTCYLRRPMYSEGHRYNCQFGIAEVCTKACGALSNENEIKARSGLCDRSLFVDLTILERHFDADRWSRLLGADQRVQSISNGFVGEPAYGRNYQRGHYLLRMLDGCIHVDEPKAHPERFSIFSSQCNSIVDIQQSLANLVGHDGKLNVTRQAILGLVDSVLGDGFQGGSSERYLRLVMNHAQPR
ncbi:hypothetical protein AC579_506 [Pseudocercospora musae]|uniref:Uncharacterized protein n=1 Tax=Pseudocercospora musae TaxID=113226 RepID=A0A139I632_9PEZI|nr:hypothetical protein AC579_506 [Pseudocercospora musae]